MKIEMGQKNCEYCFEKVKNCVCEFFTCSVCKKEFPSSLTYEYRGAYACQEHFKEATEKREEERKNVMEITNASIESQRNGEFINNRQKYHLGNVMPDGLPRMKVKEPQILKDYEKRV